MPADPPALLDLALETVLPLSRAHHHPLLQHGRQPGKPIARGTLERWRTRGVLGADGRRVVLETMLYGGSRVTTTQAVERFLAALNGVTTPTASPSQLRREHARAERELENCGI